MFTHCHRDRRGTEAQLLTDRGQGQSAGSQVYCLSDLLGRHAAAHLGQATRLVGVRLLVPAEAGPLMTWGQLARRVAAQDGDGLHQTGDGVV